VAERRAATNGGNSEIWTEQFQAALHDAHIEMVETNRTANGGELAGLPPWILQDFRAPALVLHDGYNRKGLASEEGERQLAFDVLRNYYESLN
jgi:beta-glucuronidase